MSIRFGTDGWRGIIADDFTFENVRICAQGLSKYINHIGGADDGLVVGYDTRFASREFALQVAEVLAGNGIKTLLSIGSVPTPAVSYGVLTYSAAGGVVITASHNPAHWNGFKFKSASGASASPEIIAQLEKFIDEVTSDAVVSIPLSTAVDMGRIVELDLEPAYVEQLHRMVDIDRIKRGKIKVIVDVMHGAGSGYLQRLIGNRVGNLLEIRGEVNPAFPGMEQPEPIARNLSMLSALVVENNADIGIAYDGDADRLGIVDENGSYVNTLQVFALLALYLLEVKGERGPIVKSITASDMLFDLGIQHGVPILETGVGFKYASPLMIKEDALMAGEESGGYGFRGHIPERDGILSGLLFLDLMDQKNMRPSELVGYLFSIVGEHHYIRKDVAFAPHEQHMLNRRISHIADITEISGLKTIATKMEDGCRFRFMNGWVMLRFSGTEPLIRIYAEADTKEKVEMVLSGMQSLLGFYPKN